MEAVHTVNPYFPLLHLPNELIIATASFLSLPDLAKLLRTNHFLHRLLTPLTHEAIAQDPDRALRSAANCDPPNEPIFRLAISKGANLQTSLTFDGKPALCFAASHGWDATVSHLLSLGPHAIAGNTQLRGITALHTAAAAGHVSTILLLLDSGPTTNLTVFSASDTGAQPLHLAICFNRLAVAKLLLSRGADINATVNNDTPLLLAIHRDHTDMVALLLDHGIEMSQGDYDTGLYRAASHGNAPMCALFLSRGANVNSWYSLYDGLQTALHVAVTWSKWDAAEVLLEHPDIDVNAQGIQEETPLFGAVLGGSKRVVERLIQRGADVNVRDSIGMTALIKQAAHCTVVDLAVTKVLLDAGTEVNATDVNGCTALWSAVESGHVEMARVLIGRGADVDVSVEGRPLLFEAEGEMVEVLLEAGVDVKARMPDGRTALHEAVRAGDRRAVRALVKAGVDINARAGAGVGEDTSGRTALYLAVSLGFVGIVKVLLKAGAEADKEYYVRAEEGVDRSEVCLKLRKVFDELGVDVVITEEAVADEDTDEDDNSDVDDE